MKFEWDEQKRLSNLQKHGLDFNDAKEMFEHPMFVRQDTRFAYAEERFIGIGLTNKRVAVVIYAERHEETYRIISLRKALKHERKLYEKNFPY